MHKSNAPTTQSECLVNAAKEHRSSRMRIVLALLLVSAFSQPLCADSIVFDSGELDHIGGLNITDYLVAIPIETSDTVNADFFQFWYQFPTIYTLDASLSASWRIYQAPFPSTTLANPLYEGVATISPVADGASQTDGYNEFQNDVPLNGITLDGLTPYYLEIQMGNSDGNAIYLTRTLVPYNNWATLQTTECCGLSSTFAPTTAPAVIEVFGTEVPEPSSLTLLLTGLALAGTKAAMGRRKRCKAVDVVKA